MSRHRSRVRRLENRLRPREGEGSGVGHRFFMQEVDGWTEGEDHYTDGDLEELRLAGQFVEEVVPIGRDGCDRRSVKIVKVPYE